MTPLRLLALLALALPWLACADGSGRVTLNREQPLATPSGVVDGPAARALAKAGAVVVDVRTPQEFAAGHVPGAKNIPYDEVRARAGEIGGPDTPVLLYCRTGRRSSIASQALKDQGFEKLWDLQVYERWSEGQ